MVGIVIVSHSKQLALGVQELAAQMVQGQVPIVVASGIDDPENPLGTDPIQVHQAIASLICDNDVLVLMDLGSAVMSAEMALEFLPEEQRDKVHLCEAPLVEGAITAVVAAASGKNIEQVSPFGFVKSHAFKSHGGSTGSIGSKSNSVGYCQQSAVSR